MAIDVLTTNPTTISGPIVGAGTAVYGSAGVTWTVTNESTIDGTGTAGIGIDFAGGGTIVNTSSGFISGGHSGIYASGGYVANSGTIAGGVDGIIEAGVATVSNAGLIVGGTGEGVVLSGGGLVTNTTSGVISGSREAVYITGAAGTVSNSGTLVAALLGVYLASGGVVSNTGSSLIQGGVAGIAVDDSGTVTNYGTVIATQNDAVALEGGVSGNLSNSGLLQGFQNGVVVGVAGTVTNTGTIIGANQIGVSLVGGGTVIDAGTISGATTAVAFGFVGANRLILDPGYALGGKVSGYSHGSATNTLELASAAGAGTVSALLWWQWR